MAGCITAAISPAVLVYDLLLMSMLWRLLTIPQCAPLNVRSSNILASCRKCNGPRTAVFLLCVEGRPRAEALRLVEVVADGG
eukprot:5006841-Pyramimonas_sp.AAC.1